MSDSTPVIVGPTISRLMGKVGAEMIGTFALLFVGCGAIMVDSITGSLSHIGVSMAFGLVITVMVYATGHISGAHFNPAVTIAFASVGRFPWREVPSYIAGQCCAAVAAMTSLRMIFPEAKALGATVPASGDVQALVLEFVLTFFLMFVITAVATDSRAEGQMAGVAIGGTVAVAALIGGPISGASMNPARSLGPAIFAGDLSYMWLYTLGPIAGAMLGAACYHGVRCSPEPPANAEGCC